MNLPHSEQGDGPAVLLLHPGIADRQIWDEHLEPLAAAGNRVVAVDLPGFGEAVVGEGPVAHWEDVLETMDALGIERAAIVGNSFGGAVALRVAAHSPRRVSSLLLFSVGGVPDPEPSAELLAVWEAEEGAREAGDLERAVDAVVSGWVRADAQDSVRSRVAAMQRRNYELHASGPQAEWAPDLLEEDPTLLGTIECPVLLAVGEQDMVDFRNAIPDLAAKMPRTETAVIPDCGHLAPLEAPEELRRLVLENLA